MNQFSSVMMAEWSSFGKELLTLLTVFVILDRILVLIVTVPGHCLLSTIVTCKYEEDTIKNQKTNGSVNAHLSSATISNFDHMTLP